MGFVEEKKENDSMNGTNCVHDGGASFEDDLKKVDDKIAMANSFEMDGDEGKHGEHEGLRQQEMPHENSQMAGLTGTSPSRQQQPINTNCNDQTAQQLLTQSSLNPQQHQRYYLFEQLGQQPNTTVSAIPQQTLGYLAQSPTNSTNGHLNLLAAQNTLVQNHQQAVAQAQVSALIGGVIAPNGIQPSNGFVTNPIPSLNGSVVPNVFPLEQQQIQTPQNQMSHQQTVQIAGSSVSSINAGFPPTLPNTVVQLTQPNAMPQSLFATVPFTAPSIFGPAGLSTSLTLSPQQTIPHYIPPTPASWGAPLPTLTVQDRPLVPPIYNGINPNYPKAQMIHSHPPIFCVHEFLTPAECDFLIEAASDAFGPAPVVGKGQGEVSPSRTSSTCYLAREDLPEYLRKVSLLTGKPVEHCELPQVGRYLVSDSVVQSSIRLPSFQPNSNTVPVLITLPLLIQSLLSNIFNTLMHSTYPTKMGEDLLKMGANVQSLF